MPEGLPLHRTTTFRLAVLYLGLFAASVAAVLAVVYLATVRFVDAQTTQSLAAELNGLAQQYREGGLTGLRDAVSERSAIQPSDTLYLLLAPDGRPMAGNISHWPRGEVSADGRIDFKVAEIARGRTGPELSKRGATAVSVQLPGDYRLLVGRDLEARDLLDRNLVQGLGIAVVVALGLGVAGGIGLSRSAMRRIDAINATTAEIMAGRLERRVPVRGSGDEIDRLAANLNAMLDRIEQLMTGLRQVTEAVAHDLRSPLTRLRSRLDLALLQDDDLEAMRGALLDATGEADRLLAIFTALLSIAEAEAGAVAERFVRLDLGGLVRDVAELYEPLAEERGLDFQLAVEAEPAVRGDAHLLSQALANLIDNAVKYSPAGGSIQVALAAADGRARISVSDRGPGIPADQRQAVLRRFYRMEASRSTPGAGLGLSLVDAIVRLHKGRLSLEDNAPGLRAVVELQTVA